MAKTGKSNGGKAAGAAPVRRCIATGKSLPIDSLLRFVVAPDGHLCADLGQELPGRGIWVGGHRDLVARAVKKRLFARAARAAVTVAHDLPEQIEATLGRRCLALLGLARRAGQLTLGYEKVRALLADQPTAIVVAAHDASPAGRRKLLSGRLGATPENGQEGRGIILLFAIEELSLALGRENVVHAALRAGGLANRFLGECRRLEDYRRETARLA